MDLECELGGVGGCNGDDQLSWGMYVIGNQR